MHCKCGFLGSRAPLFYWSDPAKNAVSGLGVLSGTAHSCSASIVELQPSAPAAAPTVEVGFIFTRRAASPGSPHRGGCGQMRALPTDRCESPVATEHFQNKDFRFMLA